MEKGISLHPEYEALLAEAGRLREELSRLFLERDHLLLQVVPYLEADYMVKVGSLEYKAYELECRAARLRRKAELVRARLNRNQPVRDDEVEAQLNEEFAEYQRRLQEHMNALKSALALWENAVFLSEKDAAEMKKLYRQTIRRLHPDMNPGAGEDQARLFHQAMEAYKNGNLAMLRTIALLTEDLPTPETMELIDELRARTEALRARTEAIEKEIAGIKGSFPCNIEEFLKDDAWVAAQARKAEARIASLREACASYERMLNDMLEGLS